MIGGSEAFYIALGWGRKGTAIHDMSCSRGLGPGSARKTRLAHQDITTCKMVFYAYGTSSERLCWVCVACQGRHGTQGLNEQKMSRRDSAADGSNSVGLLSFLATVAGNGQQAMLATGFWQYGHAMACLAWRSRRYMYDHRSGVSFAIARLLGDASLLCRLRYPDESQLLPPHEKEHPTDTAHCACS